MGVGTLYRHFPTRESLVLEVYRKEIDALAALAPTLLSRHPPLQALRTWCDRLAKFGRMMHGLADMLHAGRSQQDLQETYWPILAAVRQLLDACERSGDIRPGADAEDFLMLLGALWRIPPTPAGEARVKRLMALLFRGLGVGDEPPPS